MLVVISDIHLTDESTCCNVNPQAFSEILLAEIKSQAERVRATEIHLLLLGDIFDLCRSDYWFRERIPPESRPWGGQLDGQTVMNKNTDLIGQQYLDILQAISKTDTCKALVKMVHDLPHKKKRPLKITYVIGNHDRMLWNFPHLQDEIRSMFRPVRVEFRTYLSDPQYGVLARHGHEWDDICHGWKFACKGVHFERNIGRFDQQLWQIQTMGEVITAELMSGLVFRVRCGLDLSQKEDREFLANVCELHNLRPLHDVMDWLTWLAEHETDKHQTLLRQSIKQALSAVLDCSLARKWDSRGWDITESLGLGLNVLRLADLSWLQKVVYVLGALYRFWQRLKQLFGARDRELQQAQQDLTICRQKQPDVQYVLNGHTHFTRHDFLTADREGDAQAYINTGTCLPLIERCSDQRTFAVNQRMTMAFFFNQDEDRHGRDGKGPTFDLWRGIKNKRYNMARKNVNFSKRGCQMKTDMHLHTLGKGTNIDEVYYRPQANHHWFCGLLYHLIERDLRKMGADLDVDGEVSTKEYFDLVYNLLAESKELDCLVLLAFDAVYDYGTDTALKEKTDLCVSNQFLSKMVTELNDRLANDQRPGARGKTFRYGASVSPNRSDWGSQLDFVSKDPLAVLMKLIPSAQHINLLDQRHRPYFEALVEAGLPLLCHVGPEYAFSEGIRRRELDHYKKLQLALDCGCTVIAAHCATPVMPIIDENWTKDFAAFMKKWNQEHDNKLWGDTSALSLDSRLHLIGDVLKLFPKEYLVHGSDFPVPIGGTLHLPGLTHDMDPGEYIEILKTSHPLDRDVRIKRAHGFDDSILENSSRVLRF